MDHIALGFQTLGHAPSVSSAGVAARPLPSLHAVPSLRAHPYHNEGGTQCGDAAGVASRTAFATGLLSALGWVNRRRRQLRVPKVVRGVGEGWDEITSDPEKGKLAKYAPLLIDGDLILAERSFKVYCPATGNLVGVAPDASSEQIESAIVAADRARRSWANLPHLQRRAALAACAAVLRKNLEALATLQTNESGRPIAETRIEIIVAAATFEKAGELLDIGVEEVISEEEDKRVVVERRPMGVVAIIAPWNAPVVLGWKPTASALACGNTVVLKPAPQTPLTTLRIGEFLRPLLPPGVLNVVVGQDTATPKPGEILTSHPMVRKVVFTGSTAVGSKVMAACSKDFKRVLLELGGNDAAIIREDCDIKATADGVFKAAFFNNGQTCVAIKRIYVHESVFDYFVDAFVSRARRASIGNGFDKGVELGPLANEVQLKHVTDLVEDARKCGGRVLCGGGAVAGPPGDTGRSTGLFYLPTIVTGIAEGTRLVDEEQFGPVVPVMPYKTDAEAIRRANATSYGLGASVWGSDIHKANKLAKQLKAGIVWVNRHCEFIRNAPFGGVGSSGIGRAGDLGQRDLAEYTELSTMVLAKPKISEPAGLPPALLRTKVDARGRAMLSKSLHKIRTVPWEDADVFEAASKEAVQTFPFQPMLLRRSVVSLVEPTGPSCVHVQGLPVQFSQSVLPLTPTEPDSAEKPAYDKDLISEAVLIGFCALLGAHIYTYEGHSGEALVRNLFQNGQQEFGWHREGRCIPAYDAPKSYYRPEQYVPEVIAALCLRSSDGASVSFVDFRALCAAAAPEDLECLRVQPLTFFDKKTGHRTEPTTVVTDIDGVSNVSAPVVDLRPDDRFVAEGSGQAITAYHRMTKLAKDLSKSITMEAGDLVMFNNKRCLVEWGHPAEDSDTWIQIVCASRAARDWPRRVVK